MKTIKLPTGISVIAFGTDAEIAQQQKVLDRRWEVTKQVCTEKGWPIDPTKLSIQQILEIREDPRWKNAGSDGE